jgi:hypothetical protein
MDSVPALAGITAKILVLLDQALSAFVTVSVEPVSQGCGLVRYTANVTDTGEALATQLSQLIFQYVGYLVGQLTAWGTTQV